MRRILVACCLSAAMGLTAAACSYGAVVAHDNGKLYVSRNDGFLFGALRKWYECTPDGAGNVTCVALSGRP